MSLQDVLLEIQQTDFNPSPDEITAAENLLKELARIELAIDRQSGQGIDVTLLRQSVNDAREKLSSFIKAYRI